MKQGVDDLSEGVNESVNEANYNTKQDAMNAYMNGKVSAKELDKIAKNDFKSSVATKKELQNFLDSGYMKSLMANTYGLKVPAMEKKVKELMRFAEGTLKEDIQYFESLDEAKSMDMKKRLKVYDKLKKGDKITIKYGSSMRGGVEKEFVVSKGKTLVGKQKVERIILQNPANPKGVKYYLYQRNGNVTMAIGDMAASIEDMHESVNEGISVFDERHFGKKGIIIMIDDNGKKVSAIFKNKKNADKYNRNKSSDLQTLLKLAKNTPYPKAIDESVNEAKEPEVITTLRKIVKNKQNDLIKDTKSGKKVRVDMNSANLMVQVYDALKKQSNKDKFVKSGIVSMGHMAYKLMKKENITEYDVETLEELNDFHQFMKEYKSDINEAEYQGRKVELSKIMQGDVKKFKVYVKNDKGNVVKVNFGQKGMTIKKDNPGARKSFRARMNCDSPGPRWKARYWSCRKW
jgi:hypothetical protein